MSKDIDAAIELQLDLMRVSASVRGDVIALLRKLEREIVGKIAGENLTQWSRARLNRQLAEIRESIGNYYKEAAAASIAVSGEVATVAAVATVAGLPSGSVLPSATTLETIVSRSVVQGAAQGAWWAKQDADTAFKFAQAVRQGLVAAETNQQIIQRVRQVMDISRKNAAALVQTSVATIANDARMAVAEANKDIIKVYRALATLDTHTCLVCAPLDGKEWDQDKKPIGHSYPFPVYPKHVNCLTGDALVTSVGDVSGVSKRWFDGDVIVIKTAGNRELTCTPNHPILTSSGWVAAGLLDVGGDVICDCIGEGEGLSDGDHENVPATIHQFSEAFIRSSKMVPMPVPLAASDFHGDGEGGKIAVIHSNRFLVDGLNASRLKHFLHLKFIVGCCNVLSRLSGLRGLLKSFPANRSASSRFVGLCDKSLNFLWGRASHACELLLASIPQWDSSFFKHAINDASGNAESLGNSFSANAGLEHGDHCRFVHIDQSALGGESGLLEDVKSSVIADAALASSILNGDAGEVCADKIVSVSRRSFSGHVYNLETGKGWYVANGIVTHNCRCLLLARPFTGEPGGARASSDGPVAAKTTFEDWLKRQPASKVDDILGKERADLYLSGKLTLDDLVNGNGKPLKVSELKSKYLN